MFIYDAVRTPRGKARKDGGLASMQPRELVANLAEALANRCGELARTPDALVLGCVTQAGDQGGHIALQSKLHAGLPDDTAVCSLNNYCASGLTAIANGAARIGAGQARIVLAGGVESMSRVPFLSDNAGFYDDQSLTPDSRFIPPVLGADRLANAEGIGRDEMDAAALVSQQRSVSAESNPALVASRIAIGNLNAEECIRPGTTRETLAAMPAAFGRLQGDYAAALDHEQFEPLHTLCHAPPICDGAGLALIGGGGLDAAPRARIVSIAETGGNPRASLTAGFAAMDKALKMSGLTLADMDRIEFMEAFGVTIAKFMRDWLPDASKVNVSGGHLAKGHPMGATGAILLSTLLDCLDESNLKYGLVVTTGAMGVGAAMVVERLN